MTLILISTVISCMFSGCTQVNEKLGLKDNNKGEQFIEDVIREKMGIEVDFTPSEEKVK